MSQRISTPRSSASQKSGGGQASTCSDFGLLLDALQVRAGEVALQLVLTAEARDGLDGHERGGIARDG